MRFSHEDTHIHTQQISSLTAWHDDYLLFIKWKWIITNVFVLIFMLSKPMRRKKRRGWSCCVRGGRGRRGGGGGRGDRKGRHTWCNFTEIYCNFCLTFCFFISRKMFLYGTNPSTVCFSFSACITEGFML